MKKNNINSDYLKKVIIVGIIFLFFGTCVESVNSSNIIFNNKKIETSSLDNKYFFRESFLDLHINYLLNKYMGSNIIYKNANSVQQTDDNGYIITGYEGEYETDNPNTFDRITLLKKYNVDGMEEWSKNFIINNGCEGRTVQQTYDKGYIIGGSSFSSTALYAMLIKTDEQGNEEWNKIYSGLKWALGSSVQQTVEGGYILTGLSTPVTDTRFSQLFLLKTDENGNEEWNQTFKFWDKSSGISVQQTQDNGYIITGLTNNFSNPFESEIILLKTDKNGNEIWRKTFAFLYINQGFSVKQTKDKGYIITGNVAYNINDTFNSYAVLLKTDEYGNLLWYKTFNYKAGAMGLSVQQTSDDGYIIMGYALSYSKYYALMIKTDTQGNEEWIKSYSGLGNAMVVSGQQTIDNGYILAGNTFVSSLSNKQYLFLLKTDEKGNLIWNNNCNKNFVEDSKILINSVIFNFLDRHPCLLKLIFCVN